MRAMMESIFVKKKKKKKKNKNILNIFNETFISAFSKMYNWNKLAYF